MTPPVMTTSSKVTITATSAADTTQSATATLTLIPVVVTVSISNAPPPTIGTGGTAAVAATVLSDFSSSGVTWSCTPVATCGSFNPAQTASGISSIYTAPATIPALGTVTITATSVSTSSVSASAITTLFLQSTPILTGMDANNAATYYQADASLKAWIAAYVVQTSTSAYFAGGPTSATTTEVGGYGEALDIAVVEDAYERTHDPAQLLLLNKMIAQFELFTGESWAGDSWNDDIGWMTNVYTRAYQITGNPDYLKVAKDNWNAAYNKGWSSDLGGGIWENNANDGDKECLSNNEFVWEGVVLYNATGDITYLNKAEAIYAWVRSHIFNSTNTANAVGAPGQLSQGERIDGSMESSNDNIYNSGTFLLAADSLYQQTGTQQYYDDAVLDITHVLKTWPIVSTSDSSGGSQWGYFFFKGLSQFAAHNNLWATYYPWMLANANAAWAQRDSNSLTWNDWTNPTTLTNSTSEALPTSSAVGIWQVLDVPAQSTIVSDSSKLAIAVAGANVTNNAPIKQETPTTPSPEQQFMVVATPDKHSAIVSALTGMAVTMVDPSTLQASTANNATAVDSLYQLSNTSQEFDLLSKTDLVTKLVGYDAIVNVNSGSNMDANGWAIKIGQIVIQWGNNPAPEANQLWTVAPVVSFGGKYQLQNIASGMALTVAGNSTTSGALVEQDVFDPANPADVWTFVPAGNGYYSIQNLNSKLSLSMSGTSNANGVLGVQVSTGTQGRSLFRPEMNAGGSYTFYEMANSLVLDDPNGNIVGGQIGQAIPTGLSSQQFAIIPQ